MIDRFATQHRKHDFAKMPTRFLETERRGNCRQREAMTVDRVGMVRLEWLMLAAESVRPPVAISLICIFWLCTFKRARAADDSEEELIRAFATGL